jgi:hypothetical protein
LAAVSWHREKPQSPLCAAEAAPSVGRLGYLGSTFVISFDVLMLAVLFHWRV